MLSERLLNHYHCTFFLPLVGLPKELPLAPISGVSEIRYPAGSSIDQDSFASFLYFTPAIRDILFNQSCDKSSESEPEVIPMREWDVNPDVFKQWRLELGTPDVPPKNFNHHHFQQTAVFKSIKLYQFFNGLYLLAYTVEPEALQKLEELEKTKNVSIFDDRCQSAVEHFSDIPLDIDEEIRHLYAELQLESWLRFTRLSRQLYPTFVEQISESKIAKLAIYDENRKVIAENLTTFDGTLPESPLDLVAPVTLHLGSLFFGESLKSAVKFLKIYDDRMFVSVAYSLAGPKVDSKTMDCIKALVAYTDRCEDFLPDSNQTADGLGFAYDPKTIIDRIKPTECLLWSHMGGYYMFNDMVNAYVSNGWFFRNIVAKKHIRFIYDRMLVQALFYQASLRHYDHLLTHTTRQMFRSTDADRNQTVLIGQMNEFIQFTNQYWFRELTNQMQGKELCSLQQNGLQLQQQYDQMDVEISRTYQHQMMLNSERVASKSNVLAFWGVLFAVVALLTTYIPFIFDNEIGIILKIFVTVVATLTMILSTSFLKIRSKLQKLTQKQTYV